MRIIKPGFEVLTKINGREILKTLELAGRTCYKSEDRITDDSALGFVKMVVGNGHEAMIEHYSVSVRIICDRGVSHEIIRHRLASYAQESTRYCNYSKDKFDNELTFILPCWFENDVIGQYPIHWDGLYGVCDHAPTMNQAESWWFWSMALAERDYFKLTDIGWTAQQARSVLPNSLKTEIVVTMNIREWRHFFKMRTAPDAHPQMREIAIPLLKCFQAEIPVLFDDLGDDL
jgi:thymidylate synthase (FAD)